MKNTIVKSVLLGLTILLLLPTLESCKKEKQPSLREQLAGEWEVRSFSVDDVEMMGLILTGSNLDLEKFTGSKGDYEWTFTYTDGSDYDSSGDYEVDEDSKEIIFDNGTDDEATYEIDLDEDRLTLTGEIEGSEYVLKFRRD